MVEGREGDGGVEPVAELRREQALDLAISSPVCLTEVKPMEVFCRSAAPALVVMMMTTLQEIGLAAVVVGQRAVVHDLEENVEDVRVGLSISSRSRTQ